MRGRALAVLGPWLFLSLSCLDPFHVDGTYRCTSSGTCPRGLTCDDGLCCDPLGRPACPTLPSPSGICPRGGAPTTYFRDDDGDGFGNAQVQRRLCALPLTGGWVTDGRDCDDGHADVNPLAPERCNGRDDNCDGQLDEGLVRTRYYRDDDGDGWGATAVSELACAAPEGYVLQSGDCEPFVASRHPGADELCNGVDDDCDSLIDEPPLADVQNDADVALRWPCVTGQPGVCAEGVFRCEGVGAATRRVCRARVDAGVERCDGLDNDCDGLVDEQPACGGPASFVNTPNATVGAFRLTQTAFLTSRCQKGVPGNVAETALPDGTWQGSQAISGGYHGWYLEAPLDAGWDLSAPDVALRLLLSDTFNPAVGPSGAWGDPAAGDAYNPVVYLCGDTDDQVVRYRITSAGQALTHGATSFDRTLQLNLQSPGNAWLIGIGSGFDTSHVHRVEVLVEAFTPDFTIHFSRDAGFSR